MFRFIIPSLVVTGFLCVSVSISSTYAEESKEPTPEEIEYLRTESSKTFHLGGNNYTTKISSGPIHYQTEDGNWEDIKLEIVESDDENFDLMNKTNSFKTYFSEKSSNDKTMIKVERDDYVIELYGINKIEFNDSDKDIDIKIDSGIENSDFESSENQAVYSFSLPDKNSFNLIYELNELKLSEKIVLDEYIGIPKITQNIRLKNLYFKEEDGRYLLYKSDADEPFLYLPKPYMYEKDNEENLSYGVKYQVECLDENQNLRNCSEVRIAKHLSDEGIEWLKKENRKYPVIIDPNYGSLAADGYIRGQNTTYSTARNTSSSADSVAESMVIGQRVQVSEYLISRSYISFDTSVLPDTAYVSQVTLTAYVTGDIFANVDFDVQIARYNWSAVQNFANATQRETAYDGCLSAAAEPNILLDTSTIGTLPDAVTSGALTTTWVSKTASTYYCLRSSRDAAGSAPGSSILSSQEVSMGTYESGANKPILSVTYLASIPPVNNSLTFVNPYGGSGNAAVADNSTTWIFRAVVSDADSGNTLNYVQLRLANSSDNSAPYNALMFRWTRSTDTFSEDADTQNAATILSTAADSTPSGNNWTLNFEIRFNNNFLNKNTNYGAQLYTIDNTGVSATNSYSAFYQVDPVSISVSSPANVSMGTISGTGTSGIGEATWTVITNNPSGYKIEWQASSAAMTNTYGDTISAYSPSVANTPELWSIPAANSEWGARLKSTSTDYSSATWGSNDTTAAKWLNVNASSLYQIAQRTSTTTGSNQIVQFKSEVGSNKFQPSGTYSVNVTVTVTTL